MLKHEEMQWLSNDGLQIFARKWEPEGEIKAVINLVHGIGEHSGRYQRWAEQLTGAGYAVMTFDLRGHGNSGGLRGHVSTFDHYADDVSLLLENTSKQFPGKPCFLYGISLGGIIVL
jgi:acylglycerol lipase